MVRPLLVASTLWDLVKAAIATILIASNQTQSLNIQKEETRTASLTTPHYRGPLVFFLYISQMEIMDVRMVRNKSLIGESYKSK